MILKVNKDNCEIKENEIWNVGDYNVHTVEVDLSSDFDGLVNKVRYFVEDKSYDMLITDNVAQVPYEATVMEGTIKIGVYGYDADTNILVQSTSPVNKYISSGTYTGEADNTEPLTPTDKEQMETAIQKNTNDITDLKANKQDKLISGVNIKTINNESILSGGNLTLIEEEADPIFTNSPAYSITDNDITYWNNKANMSDIPDVSNFITKDVDNLTYYTKSTDMQTAINNAVGDERTARENADNSLQNQIDAITVSSDVVDVVSTYQDLIDYDTQHIKVNDIIKVMQDSTHDNAISYYRWVIVNHVGSWVYVGSEGPYYTKSETDTLLNAKQNTLISGQNIKTINSESLLGEGNIIIQGGGTSDYTDLTNKPKINNVELVGNKSLNDLGIQPAGNYALESDMTEAQNDIEALQTENERLKATLPTTTGEGQDITLNKTAEMEFVKPPLPMGNSEQESTTGKNLLKPEGAPTTIRGVSWSYREDGAVVGERVSSNENASDFTLINSSTFQPGSYIYSCFDSESTPGASKYQSNISINGVNHWGTGNYSFVLNEVSTIRVVLRVYPNFTGTAIFKPMIRLSSIQESNYEPYTGGIPSPNPDYPQEIRNVTGDVEVVVSNADSTKSQTFTFPLGNEKLMLGDYLADDGIHHLRKQIVLNGSENWTVHGSIASWFYWDGLTDGFVDKTISGYALSNYFTQKPYSTVTSLNNGEFAYGQVAGSTRKRLVLKDTDYTTVADFKTWLSINNVTIEYELVNEEITPYTAEQQQVYNLIKKALSYEEQTNISGSSGESNPIFDVEAYQSTKLILENLDSRLTLVEG